MKLNGLLVPTGPGIGDGWTRLAEVIRGQLPVQSIDGIWVFRPIRHQAREYGTAIVSVVTGARRQICTAQYALAIKGKTRGQFQAELAEVGSGPLEALTELLGQVPKRSDDEEPPTAIAVEQWFTREEPPVADEG